MMDYIKQKIVEYLREKLKQWAEEILKNEESDSHPTLMKIGDNSTVHINISVNIINMPNEDSRKDGIDNDET